MQRFTTQIAVLVLVAAACGGDDGDAAPAEEPVEAIIETSQEVATTQPTTEAPSAVPAAPAAAEIEARVVFDGENCSYQGPIAVPEGARVNIDFDATVRPDSVALVVLGADPGTTWDQVVESAETLPASGDVIPSWVLVEEPFEFRLQVLATPGVLTTALEAGLYAITCNTAPDDTDKVHPAALIEAMPVGVAAKVTFDGDSCVYEGPSAVAGGTQIEFELIATARPESVALVVLGVVEDTTWDEVVEAADTLPASSSELPAFAMRDRLSVRIGPGSLVATLATGQYLVSCNTAPEDTDRVHPAALIDATLN